MNFCVNTGNSLKSSHFGLSSTGDVLQQTVNEMQENYRRYQATSIFN